MAPPKISKERAEVLLAEHLPAFGRCFLEAERDWLSHIPSVIRKDATETWKARFYWERAVLQAGTYLVADGLRHLMFRGIPMVEVNDAAWVRFKKMHADKSTVGYPTVQRLTVESQGHMGWQATEQTALPWGEPHPILVCGYTLDRFGRIDGLYVAYPNGARNAYDIPISVGAALDFVPASKEQRTPGVLTDIPIVRRRAE